MSCSTPSEVGSRTGTCFLLESVGYLKSRTVFAGDSGNDLPALRSGLPSVLVRNALEEVRREALRIVEERGFTDRL